MTQETAWLDYTKAPPGYGFSILKPKADQILAMWLRHKREHDPPDMTVAEVESVVPEIDGWGFTVGNQQWSADWGNAEARAAAWVWYDRRRAIVLDINEQTCSGGKHLAAWMALALAWTDAECAEVEAYAALPFPRGIDMPQALQRLLLPRGVHTS